MGTSGLLGITHQHSVSSPRDFYALSSGGITSRRLPPRPGAVHAYPSMRKSRKLRPCKTRLLRTNLPQLSQERAER